MGYDYRNQASSPHDPPYRTSTSSGYWGRLGHPSFHLPSSSSSGLGIRVTLKPEHRITHLPQLLPQAGNIARSNFQFNFYLEQKILAEAGKDTQNWSWLSMEHLPPKSTEPSFSLSSSADPVVAKYVASGLNREAVTLAVANYGDHPTKVREFVNGFTLLQEMGFSSNNVGEALIMYDNDTDKALAHFLDSSA